MSTKEQIIEFVEQLDEDKQKQLLSEIKQMFLEEVNPILKEKLTQRVHQAEADIVAGRFNNRQEVEQRMKKFLEV